LAALDTQTVLSRYRVYELVKACRRHHNSTAVPDAQLRPLRRDRKRQKRTFAPNPLRGRVRTWRILLRKS
jgi:hypothetical protein